MALTKINLDDFEVNQTSREIQRVIMACARVHKDLELTYSVEAKSVILISRTSRKYLVKVDLLPKPGVFCKITDVLEMEKYMDRTGDVKAWDDHPAHTSVLGTPTKAIEELTRRLNSATAAYAQRRWKFDYSLNR